MHGISGPAMTCSVDGQLFMGKTQCSATYGHAEHARIVSQRGLRPIPSLLHPMLPHHRLLLWLSILIFASWCSCRTLCPSLLFFSSKIFVSLSLSMFILGIVSCLPVVDILKTHAQASEVLGQEPLSSEVAVTDKA